MKSVSFARANSRAALAPNANRAKANKFCLIVVDKTITVDHRILISCLLLVFLLFFLAIIVAVFMLSVYIWLK
jgi:hypothetical protein